MVHPPSDGVHSPPQRPPQCGGLVPPDLSLCEVEHDHSIQARDKRARGLWQGAEDWGGEFALGLPTDEGRQFKGLGSNKTKGSTADWTNLT